MSESVQNIQSIQNVLIKVEFEGLPPTVNHMYMNAQGRRFRTKECREFQDKTTLILKSLWSKEPYLGRVALSVDFLTSNRRRWDLDNRLKALQDCLQLSGVIKDDSQVDAIFLKRCYSKKNATILILSEISDIFIPFE